MAGWCQTCLAERLKLRWSATLVAPQPMFEQLDGREEVVTALWPRFQAALLLLVDCSWLLPVIFDF